MDGVTGIKMHWRCAFQQLFLFSLTIQIFYGMNVYAELLSRDLVQWICNALKFKKLQRFSTHCSCLGVGKGGTVHAWKVLWSFSLWNEYSFDAHVQFFNLWKPPKYIEWNIWWFILQFCSFLLWKYSILGRNFSYFGSHSTVDTYSVFCL